MYVVTWNKEQSQWLKVETLEEHLRFNLDAFKENRSSHFLCLGIFPTHDQASQFCSELRTIRDNERRLG
ncbi:MAG: hypothetical protein Q4A60_06310 [Pasteurellaceae bacterium]|nr:hypothetical protein [Pasteurellaceae bacterium]